MGNHQVQIKWRIINYYMLFCQCLIWKSNFMACACEDCEAIVPIVVYWLLASLTSADWFMFVLFDNSNCCVIVMRCPCRDCLTGITVCWQDNWKLSDLAESWCGSCYLSGHWWLHKFKFHFAAPQLFFQLFIANLSATAVDQVMVCICFEHCFKWELWQF